MTARTKDQEKALLNLVRLIGAGVVAGVLAALIALPGVGSAGLAARDASNSFQNMENNLDASPPPEKTEVRAADGAVIATFYDENRESVPLAKVAPIMKNAVLAIEDARFYQHGPLDLQGTLRALISNAQAGDVRQGGSTLTQQYVKNLLVENAKTAKEREEARAPNLGRKIRELRYAIDLEEKLTKNQIFEGYLNIAYFGSGAYGVQAAAQRYFSKDAADLNLEQAALLAGITNSPTAYNPFLNPKDARKRRNTVINRMAQLGMISAAEADTATKKSLKLKRKQSEAGNCTSSEAPFFCEYVRNEILNNQEFGSTSAEREQLLRRGGLTIHTTLDPTMQEAAQRALNARVGPRAPRAAAEAMVQPGTGRIKALAVSKKFGGKKGETVVNLAANQAHGGGIGYSAGSTFKIFTLAAALEEGIPVRTSIRSPQSTRVGGFTDCKGRPLEDWSVSNAGDSEAGTFNLRSGTEHSVNTFFAQLEKRVGVCDAVRMAEKFGIKRSNGKPLEQVAPQVLGTNEVDATSLAAAYAGFAARGEFCRPIAITKITDRHGKELEVPRQNCKQAIDAEIADEVNDILKGVLTRGTAAGNSIGRPAAGKTGTCEEFTCALFAGHTPDLAAAVWYGHPDNPWVNRVYGVYGATIPAPIWRQSMIDALLDTPPTPFKAPVDRFGDVDQVDVPDVVGLPLDEAVERLEEAGFEIEISRRPVRSNQPAETVARTTPDPGDQADEGATVTVYISRGRSNDGND